MRGFQETLKEKGWNGEEGIYREGTYLKVLLEHGSLRAAIADDQQRAYKKIPSYVVDLNIVEFDLFGKVIKQ